MRLLPVLRYAGLLTFGYLLLVYLSYPNGAIGYPLYILVIGCCLWWIAKKRKPILPRRDTSRAFITLMVFGGLVRFLWAILVPTLPVSDFQYFHENALQISQGIATVTKNMGYTLILSSGYSLYPGVITGKVLNATASTLSILLVYRVGSKLVNPLTGLIAAFLFAILPSEINMVSVLGTEVLATTLGLATAYFLSRVEDGLTNRSILWIPCAGLFYGVGLTVKISLVFYVPLVYLLVIFFLSTEIKQRITGAGIFTVGLTTGLGLIVLWHSLIAGHLTFESLRAQNSFPILSGTNPESLGRWNRDDSELYSSWSAEERDKKARQVALERITSKPLDFLKLISQKFAILMGPNDYGNTWSLNAIDWGKGNAWGIRAPNERSNWGKYKNLREEFIAGNGIASQIIYLLTLFFAAYAYMRMDKSSPYLTLSLIVLALILLTLLPHTVLEVQGRYHHHLMPFIALFAACGLYQSGVAG